MKINRELSALFALFMPLVLVFSSCVRDNLDICYTNTVALSYRADGTSEVIAEYIPKVDLYIYDEATGSFFSKEEVTINGGQGGRHEIQLDLPQGKKYRIVAIGNAGTHTTLKGVEGNKGASIQMGAPKAFNNSVPSTNDYLYVGSIVVEAKEAFSKEVDVLPMRSAHYKIVAALSKSSFANDNGEIYQLHMSNLPTIAGGDGVAQATPLSSYVMDMTTPAGENLEHKGAVLRFADASQIEVKLMESKNNVEVMKFNLGDYLTTKAPNVNLSLHEATITFYFSGQGVNITVEPWNGTSVNPIL